MGCLLIFASCQKNSNGHQSNATITLSSNQVARNQSVFATASGSSSQQAVVRWSIQPATNNWLSAGVNRSVMLFLQKGTYTVTANYFTDSAATVPYDSSSSPVYVSDSVWSDTTLPCGAIENTPFTAGDQILLTPYIFSDSAGLVLTGHTQDLYMNPLQIDFNPFTPNIPIGDYLYALDGVQTAPCAGASAPAPAITYLFLNGLTTGMHSITIEFNNRNYTGSVLVTDTDCTITWNYTSGVLISPLHISKQ